MTFHIRMLNAANQVNNSKLAAEVKQAIAKEKARIAASFNTTVDRLNQQYLDNADGMHRLATKAEAAGKKVNGFTASELNRMVANFKAIAEC